MAALLGEVGRRQVDGDALGRQRQAERMERARTRSRDSPTALSGRPTTVKAGRPEAMVTCASTASTSMPENATV
jgi:hypothetical protein